MAKLIKRKIWITIMVVTFISVFVLFFSQANSVRAMLGDDYMHMMEVLWRVESEIMQNSPAGQYYEALLWKHNDELSILLTPDRPEHLIKIFRVTRMFIPGLEALLDDKGDTVLITKEQVNSLKAELDWIASVGSPSLREDIEKEQQRFPLENFIGMTMSEALDHINSNWPPDLTAESIEQAMVATQTPQPPPIPMCFVGTASKCLAMPLLIPDSNGQLAYYVYDNVYFEYPSNWQIQKITDNHNELIIAPTPESPEGSNFSFIALMFTPNLVIENWSQVLIDFPSVWERPNTAWRSLIYLEDFQGFENLWRYSENPIPGLEFFFYNESHQLGFGVIAVPVDNAVADLIISAEAAREMFPNLYQLVESIRIAE